MFIIQDIVYLNYHFQIFEYLENHVIGQETAKKVLSVAVYNHYKRVYHNIPVSRSEPLQVDISQSNNLSNRGNFSINNFEFWGIYA